MRGTGTSSTTLKRGSRLLDSLTSPFCNLVCFHLSLPILSPSPSPYPLSLSLLSLLSSSLSPFLSLLPFFVSPDSYLSPYCCVSSILTHHQAVFFENFLFPRQLYFYPNYKNGVVEAPFTNDFKLQWLSSKDIGVWALHIFNSPSQFNGKSIGIFFLLFLSF